MNLFADAADGAAPLEHVRVELELRFPSDVRYIERVVELVRLQCHELRYPPHHCSLNVPVALTEALSNAILRGNGEDRTKTVSVRAEVDPARLVLEVADEGIGFDLEKMMVDPTLPENLDREDGRGLFLMRSLMDLVERFDRNGIGEGNVVRLVLHRG
ncbi:MAG TPA: ATP-binding protein [Gemmatimonadaceae bacterium]